MSKQTGLEPIIDKCCKVINSFNRLREQISCKLYSCDLYKHSITPLQLSNLKESNGRKLIVIDLNLENILKKYT